MKVILIEDEINAFEYLRTIFPKTGFDIEILEHLDSVQDSVNWLNQHPAPDLIFLDIQLADGLSFEIFNHVEVKSPIIFTTAYDQYAIDAFKFNSIDYLLKPIHIDDLKKASMAY
ncbi:MAG: response regulator [Bacteroidota bacterium]